MKSQQQEKKIFKKFQAFMMLKLNAQNRIICFSSPTNRTSFWAHFKVIFLQTFQIKIFVTIISPNIHPFVTSD